MGSFADDMRAENEALRKRFVFHTRPNKGLLSWDEAHDLNMRTMYPRYGEALQVARNQGCTGLVHHVEDAWGGYWQCESEHGPYTFRLPPC